MKLLDTIGNTPLVEVTRFNTGMCELYLKLELANPGGSIKDRIAKAMIEVAEREGKIKPGDILVEATAGNTGIGLALIGRLKGYRCVLCIPDKMSREKVQHLKGLGAEVIMTRSDVTKEHPDYYQNVAARYAEATPRAWFVDQFSNPANSYAHEVGTGPEIWEQMEHKVDAVICGVGSAGTMTGLSRFFNRVDPNVELVLADPVGSILVEYIKTGVVSKECGSWYVEGIGEDFIPSIADLSRVKTAYSVTDEESFTAARELLRREGILAGSSSGTLFAAALAYCRDQTTPKRVVTFACDTGNKYLSKMYSDDWMEEQGFSTAPNPDL